MHIRKLERQEVCSIYEAHLVRDFPPDEQKPLDIVLDALDSGDYLCTGLFREETLLGYAFFVVHGEDYLLDYLAVLPAQRCKGMGSRFLELLQEFLPQMHSLIVEAEDPAYSEIPEETALQQRRIRFYLRSGFVDSGTTVLVFGVYYKLLHLPGIPSEAVLERYLAHYRAMVPEELYRKNVFVPNENESPEG